MYITESPKCGIQVNAEKPHFKEKMQVAEDAMRRLVQKFQFEPKSTLPELAASYSYEIARNHPFFDGNKRSAMLAAIVFLEINGMKFHATEEEAVLETLALAAGERTEEEYASWLTSNST